MAFCHPSDEELLERSRANVATKCMQLLHKRGSEQCDVKHNPEFRVPCASTQHCASTPTCQGCNKRFTFFDRRHHCRGCLETVCDDCAPKNVERICKACKTKGTTFSKAPSCENCKKDFTVFTRRHHCRSCYKSMCKVCAPHNVERHCLDCMMQNTFSKASFCENCTEDFTLLKRRHHCRRCLKSFCGACSKTTRGFRECHDCSSEAP
jgi:hypothetical protein